MPSHDEAAEKKEGEPGPPERPSGQAPAEAPPEPAKRQRGRPRKNPLAVVGTHPPSESGAPGGQPPEGVLGHVAVASGESRLESALLMHKAPEAAATEAASELPAPARRPRGRPRKHLQASGLVLPSAPGSPPAASLGGTAIQTQEAAAVAPVPPATAGQAAVILKRPRGRPRKHPLPDAGGISGGVSVPRGETGQPGLVGEKQVLGLVAESGGAAAGRPRGRKRKSEPSILNPFCPDCGTYLRMFRPPRGRWRKVCPRCEPERMVVKRDYRDYIDKTGMPCKDRGKCRPERCVKALECEEMGRYR